MSPILNVVLPVFGIILTGYLCGRFRILGEASTDALNRFVYFVALPALFVISMARVEIGEILNGPFLIALGGAQLAAFALAIAVARLVFPARLGALSLHGLTAVFANTGYMGLPLLQTAFGEAGVLPAVVATVWHGAVVMGIGIVLLEADFNRGAGPIRLLLHVGRGRTNLARQARSPSHAETANGGPVWAPPLKARLHPSRRNTTVKLFAGISLTSASSRPCSRAAAVTSSRSRMARLSSSACSMAWKRALLSAVCSPPRLNGP